MNVNSVTEKRKAARVLGFSRSGTERATASSNKPPSIGCRLCPFVASARRDGRAIDDLCGHIVYAHRPAGIALPGTSPEAA